MNTLGKITAFFGAGATFAIFYLLANFASNYGIPLDPFGIIQIKPFSGMGGIILLIGGLASLIVYFTLSRKTEVKT